MKGTVRSWDDKKGFGHIRSEGGGKEVFLHHSALESADARKLLGPGAEAEFELETPEPAKGPKAKNVKVLSQGHTPATTPPSVPQGLIVSWTFGESTSRRDDLSVPVWVKVIRGNKPVGGTEVNLKADGVAQGDAVVTGEDGEAFFRIYLIPNAIGCDLLATVDDKNFTHRWDLPKTLPAREIPVADLEVYCQGNSARVTAKDAAGKPMAAQLTIAPHKPRVKICTADGKKLPSQPVSIPAGSTVFFFYHAKEEAFNATFTASGVSRTKIVYPKRKERS